MTAISDLTTIQRTMLAVVEIFENGKPNTFGLAYFNPATHELSGGLLMASFLSGNMGKLLLAYQQAGGKMIDQHFIDVANTPPHDPTVLGDGVATFKAQFSAAASDPIMDTIQQNFFSDQFLTPAEEHAAALAITEPLGILTILDSYVQGGFTHVCSLMPIGQTLNQWDWVRTYIETRKNWLASRPVTAHTVYRMQALEGIVQANNWKLDLPLHISSQNYTITEKDVT